MVQRQLAVLITTALLGGCVSSLDIQRYDPTLQQVGYPHRLRMTQYLATLTWRVVACDAKTRQPLKFKMSAEIKEATALDPDQFYVVDPRSLQGPFRVGEFTMEWYEDRGTKSIGASVDDQAGAAIGTLIAGVSKLAGAGLLPAGSGTVTCPPEVQKALVAINGVKGDARQPGQKAVTEEAESAVSAQTLVVTRIAAQAAEAGNELDGRTRGELRNARAKLATFADRLAAEQAKLKALNDVVTDSGTITWPETGSEFTGGPFQPSPAAYKRWQLADTDKAAKLWFRLQRLDLSRRQPEPAPIAAPLPPTPADGVPDIDAAPAARPGAIGPAPVSDGQPDFSDPDAVPTASAGESRGGRSKEKIPGLPYREPMRVRLDICNGGPCVGSLDDLRRADLLVASHSGLALQGGALLYGPFRAQTFANIKNSMGFAQSNVLTTAGSSQLRGAGSGAVDAVKTGAEQLASVAEGARTAETKRLTAEAEEAKARKALADAEAALQPKPDAAALAQIAAFQTEATLATSEKSMLDAQAALAATQKLAGAQ